MINQQEYRKAKEQIERATNREKVLESLVAMLEQNGDKTTPLERYWLARGMVIGYLARKNKIHE